MKKLSVLSIPVSLAILFVVGNLSLVTAQTSDTTVNFLNDWTADLNSRMPMRIMEVDLSKAFSYCPERCQGKSTDYHIRIRGKVFGYTADNPIWTDMAKMIKPNLLREYCSSGANLRNIELLSATYDSTEKHVFYYRIKPDDCPAATTPNSPGSNSIEEQFWDLVKNSKDVKDYQSYIDLYPSGKYIALARLQKSRLSGQNNTTNRNDSTAFLNYGLATTNQGNFAYLRSWAAQAKSQLPLNFGDVEIYDLYGPSKDENYFYIIGWTPRLSSPVDTRSQGAALKAKFLPEYCRSVAYRRKITLAIWVSDNNKQKNFGHMLIPGDCSANELKVDTRPTAQTDAEFLNDWATEVRVGLPEYIAGFQLKTAWSRCASGCQESDSVNYLLLKFDSEGEQQHADISDLEKDLKPTLLIEYCKTDAIRRKILLGVFFDNRAQGQKVNFWVQPKDCPAN